MPLTAVTVHCLRQKLENNDFFSADGALPSISRKVYTISRLADNTNQPPVLLSILAYKVRALQAKGNVDIITVF